MPLAFGPHRATQAPADAAADAPTGAPSRAAGGVQGGSRPPRRAVRLALCALLPLALLAGCSHSAARSNGAAGANGAADSGETGGSASAGSGTAGGAGSSPSPSATARYGALPDPCTAISRATVLSLVPGTTKPAGTPVGSGDAGRHGGCSWNGLHGYQYRFLDTVFQRFDALAGAPAPTAQAQAAFGAAVRTATAGAAQAKAVTHTAQVPGIGDQATLITWDVTKDKAVYRTASVVTRSANAIVTVDYVGAGLEGDRRPTTSSLRTAAERAAKEALAALR
jgi:hypothetical protein